MKLRIRGIPSQEVEQIRRGEPDANGQKALRRIAEGGANPCRHCLGLIAEGEPMLVLSYRPFETPQPYAETGPIFLHAEHCPHYDAGQLPAWFAHMNPAIIRGYDESHWIRYDTAAVIPGTELTAQCERLLQDAAVSYVHVRSRFNCFQCQVERG
jgi:hypothetical protein